MEKPEVSRAVFYLAGAFARHNLSLLPPTLHIPTAKHSESLALADIIGVGGIRLYHAYNLGGYIAYEAVVRNESVGELN